MSPVKILIVEDEFIISEKLAQNLKQVGYIIMGIFTSGEEVLKQMDSDTPDLIIMDIKLEGELDGIQTATQINKIHPIPIIYLTGLNDQKIFNRAKITHPASFLSKPYNQYDVNNAIELALHNAAFPIEKINEETTDSLFVLTDRIFVKDSKNCFNKIGIEDILWIEGEGSYSIIETLDGQYMTSYNLKAIEKKIQHSNLLRIHRSYIINLNRIKQIVGKSFVILEYMEKDSDKTTKNTNGIIKKKIPIGPEYREKIQKYLRLL